MEYRSLSLSIRKGEQIRIGDNVIIQFYKDKRGKKKVRITTPDGTRISREKDMKGLMKALHENR